MPVSDGTVTPTPRKLSTSQIRIATHDKAPPNPPGACNLFNNHKDPNATAFRLFTITQ